MNRSANDDGRTAIVRSLEEEIEHARALDEVACRAGTAARDAFAQVLVKLARCSAPTRARLYSSNKKNGEQPPGRSPRWCRVHFSRMGGAKVGRDWVIPIDAFHAYAAKVPGHSAAAMPRAIAPYDLETELSTRFRAQKVASR
jgi:hypothetical protein